MTKYRFRINEEDFEVEVKGVKDNRAEVVVNGGTVSVSIESGEQVCESCDAASPESGRFPAKPVSNDEHKVTAPLPGVIVELCVKAGDVVRSSDRIGVLEAMKMENDILAERDGIVSDICVSKGDSVLEGSVIAIIK